MKLNWLLLSTVSGGTTTNSSPVDELTIMAEEGVDLLSSGVLDEYVTDRFMRSWPRTNTKWQSRFARNVDRMSRNFDRCGNPNA